MVYSKINIILLTITLFANIIFSGYYILVGKVYGGADTDNTFIIFMMFVDVIPLLLFYKYIKNTKYSRKNVVLILFILLSFLTIMLMEGDFSYILVKSFIAYSIPSALIGILISKYKAGNYMAKWLEPLMLFLTMVGVKSMPYIMFMSRDGVKDHGIGTQSLSYYCGFAFGINLYFIMFGNEVKDRFTYSKTILYKFLSYILLIVQTIVSLSSGGRGGFVLLFTCALTLLIIKLFKRKKSQHCRKKTLFKFLVILFLLLFMYQFVPNNIKDVVELGSERTFSYISKNGIDMSETSNRDDVYGDAIKAIEESPFIGYGLLMKGTFIEDSWPHNIVLEILLQGGVVYLFFFLIILYLVTRKLFAMCKSGHGLYLIPITLYPMIMLCFSGSYVATGLFWFLISYIICYEINPRTTIAQSF